MIALIKRYSTLLFIAASAGLLLLRLKFSFDYRLSISAILCLAIGKFFVDSHGSEAGFIQRMRDKARQSRDSFASLLRLEKEVHLALVGRYPPKPAAPAMGEAFAFSRTNDYGLVVGLLVIGSLVDIPLLHLLVHHVVSAPYRQPAHGMAALITCYGLVWVISDYRAIKASRHEVTMSEIRFRLGWRVSGVVPVAGIRSVRPAPDSIRRWRIDQGLRRNDVGLITPLDAPNILVEIDPGPCFRVMSAKRQAARYLAIYVDDPERLIRCLRSRIRPDEVNVDPAQPPLAP